MLKYYNYLLGHTIHLMQLLFSIPKKTKKKPQAKSSVNSFETQVGSKVRGNLLSSSLLPTALHKDPLNSVSVTRKERERGEMGLHFALQIVSLLHLDGLKFELADVLSSSF